MRRLAPAHLAALAGAALGIACASAGTPPGGPERKTPPVIVSISPDSGQTNAKVREVEFKFDEVVSDRPSGPAANLDQLFLVSPRDGTPNVSWHRNRITVRPRKGFRPNTAYRVTMLPGLADLRGNVLKQGVSILFSTGSTFPPFGIVGRVFDWEAQRPANGAYVEAISRQDTTLVFVTATDTSGMFDVGPLPAGVYTVRALIDQNGNRAIDQREKWDSSTVQVAGSKPTIELDAIERDTLAAAITNTAVEDSVSLRLTFDKPLDPRIVLRPDLFRLQRADSSDLQIVRAEFASVHQRAKAVADSIRRAATDTARRVPPAATPAAPSGVRPPPPPPKPRAPAPENAVVLTVSPSTPLVPGRYVVQWHDLPNLIGRASASRRGFTIAPPPPRDTTRRAPADTTRRPPPAGRPPLHR